ncbi:hypothetical protein RBSH_03097 [Rhodopirellula baltica SH28]|uniref:Uncharacterized protein n=1 Tax=Rhodopirellula baltica SH28 TaxID=993517 RepID=K5DFN2_RHOBT|nr:hypothetical protein RBSH_03097 [Rhodopirellula baltica SH28]
MSFRRKSDSQVDLSQPEISRNGCRKGMFLKSCIFTSPSLWEVVQF